MLLSEHQIKFTHDVCRLLQFIWDCGYEVTFGEVYRTPEQQKINYEKGLSKTLNSMHLKRLAVDLNFYKDGKYVPGEKIPRATALYWKSLSTLNRAGQDWGWDAGHFERFVND